MRRQSRTGIVYNMNEDGTARIVFSQDMHSFQGVLETRTGETISVKGQLVNGSPEPSTSTDILLMNIHIVDGEAGSSFCLENVAVNLRGPLVSIDNPSINFAANDRLIGVRAEREIHYFMSPKEVNICMGQEVFVGPMQVRVLTSQRPTQSIRRESICDTDVRILEQSDDFLA